MRFLFCIGAQKSGTTYIYHQLELHPDIWCPPSKELHFFNYRSHPDPLSHSKKIMNRTLNSLKNSNKKDVSASIEWLENAIDSNKTDLEWYCSLFPESYKIGVDVSPAYALMDIHNFKYMAYHFPDAYILFIMRDPISRLWSLAKKQQNRKNPNNLNKLYNKKRMIRFFESEGNYKRMRYDWTIQKLESVFPRNNIFYAFYEDIFFTTNGKNEYIKSICNHIGVNFDESFFTEIDKNYLPSPKINIDPKIANIWQKRCKKTIDYVEKKFGRVPDLWKYRYV